MKTRYILLIALANFILQVLLTPYLRVAGIAPNTALVLTVVIAMLGGLQRGLGFGLMAGLLQDLFFSKALGFNVLVYGLIALGIGILESKLFKDNRLTPAVLVIGSTVFYYVAAAAVFGLAEETVGIGYLMMHKLPIEALYNTAVCLLFYRRLFARVYGYGLR